MVTADVHYVKLRFDFNWFQKVLEVLRRSVDCCRVKESGYNVLVRIETSRQVKLLREEESKKGFF